MISTLTWYLASTRSGQVEFGEALAAANKKAVSDAAEVLEGVSIDSDSSDIDSIDCAESPVVRQQLREAKFQLETAAREGSWR